MPPNTLILLDIFPAQTPIKKTILIKVRVIRPPAGAMGARRLGEPLSRQSLGNTKEGGAGSTGGRRGASLAKEAAMNAPAADCHARGQKARPLT